MDRTRIKLAVYVDLDPIPGTFHSAESARNSIEKLLRHSVQHYNPAVSIESYDINSPIVVREPFDDENPNWSPDRESNRLFIKAQAAYHNARLEVKGHVFLNEIYDALGIPRTSQGALCGWMRGSKLEINVVETTREGGLYLEIPVDGLIYNRI